MKTLCKVARKDICCYFLTRDALTQFSAVLGLHSSVENRLSQLGWPHEDLHALLM